MNAVGDIARECSPFLDGLITRHPDWFEQLQTDGRLGADIPPQTEALESEIAENGLDPGLRRFRNREMLRIAWRELNRAATLEETLSDLSTLAELCLRAAIEHHDVVLRDRFGTPLGADGNPQSLCVLALGKLGGLELNLSSDIDIVFTFPGAGATSGGRRLPNEQYFTRLARQVIRSLSEVTGDGFCFRVDTRLRPFGASGPLVCSFGAMEQYYQREGRDWERYALVKARPVAGDPAAGQELVASLAPFVYRRYIDFGAVEALHDMRDALREDARRQDRGTDIKRGPGGIREIEFLVQAFQLLRGGREPSLRTPSLALALDALASLGVLPIKVANSLREDYSFLRRLENAIQALHDRQEHRLPEGEDLARVTRVMGFESAAALVKELEQTRQRVRERLRSGFPERPAPAADAHAAALWLAARAGQLDASDPLSPALGTFTEGLQRQSLSTRAAERLDRFMPVLLHKLAEANFGDRTLQDVFNLVQTISRRSAYLSLLVQNPAALERMLALFAASDWVSGTVIRYPALLDELIDPALGRSLPDDQEMRTTISRLLENQDDPEAALASLNHVKLAFSLRVAVAELENSLSARRVQETLSALAACVIEACQALAFRDLARRHGTLPGPGLAVIAYGSLGAAELGYGSDLDLVFLYQGTDARSNGDRPLACEPYFTRLARRLLGYLTANTPSGRLYEVDTRLRPNGRAGLLVSSLEAFEKYQAEQAWTWELQALSRARYCAGDPDVGAAFEVIRREVLGRERSPDEVASEVREMRQRMHAAHDDGDPLKHGDAGLVDIGFVAQLGVLLNAAAHPGVLEARDSPGQLQALQEAGWITAGQYETLADAFDELTRHRHAQLLLRKPPAHGPDNRACADLCRALLGAQD